MGSLGPITPEQAANIIEKTVSNIMKQYFEPIIRNQVREICQDEIINACQFILTERFINTTLTEVRQDVMNRIDIQITTRDS